MADRTELLEAALDCLPEGIALIGAEGQVLLWNRAAEAITGYASADLLSRAVPEALALTGPWPEGPDSCAESQEGRSVLIHLGHHLGHNVPVTMRTLVLRDGLGKRIGTAAVFHPVESLDAMPHGEHSEGSGADAGAAELETRLESTFEDFRQGGESFGVLWIAVDQAHELRKTHGTQACESMLTKVERALANGLRPAEEIGRWGDYEFLVISHERTAEMLAAHARMLAGLARTADFRWWGDRVSVTVSMGAAQAEGDGSLVNLLERARRAMLSSFHAGGNQITPAPGGQVCSPS
jgi:diguanylate cyclase (GGDEF)-like protein/PAS domain S-box-containing protein